MSATNHEIIGFVLEAQRLEAIEAVKNRESMNARDKASSAWLDAGRLLHPALRAGLSVGGLRQSKNNDMFFWANEEMGDGLSFWLEVQTIGEKRSVDITARHNSSEVTTFGASATCEDVFAAAYRFAIAYRAFIAAEVPPMPDLTEVEAAAPDEARDDEDDAEQTNIGQAQKAEPTLSLESPSSRGKGGTRRDRGAGKALSHTPAPTPVTVPAPDLFSPAEEAQ